MAERKQAIAVARLPYEFSTAEIKHVMALTKPHATTGHVDGKVHYLNLYTT